jgi:hypothetical protein
VNFKLDLSHLPTKPAPWTNVEEVAGYSICRQGCMPSSPQRATAWAKQDKRNGARFLRFHHTDLILKNDPSRWLHVQYMLSAAQRQGIACAIEFASETPLTLDYVRAWGKLDLSNVVLASVTNEAYLDPSAYQKWVDVIRNETPYRGLLFGSNTGMLRKLYPDMEFGDVESTHVYAGHPRNGYEFKTSYPEHSDHNAEPNALVRLRPDLPLCIMECGTPYTNPWRGISDVAMYDKFRGIGASVVCAFAYCSSDAGRYDEPMGHDKWGFSNEPLRFMAFQYAARVWGGETDALPFSNNLRYTPAPDALYQTSPTYQVR